MNPTQLADANSPAVQKHVEIMQGVINRMAENSRACKIWCVTLVSAILVLVARTGEPTHALIALAPAIILYILDSYYLSLERAFRQSYSGFVEKVHAGQLSAPDIYSIAPRGSIGARSHLGNVQVFLRTAVLWYGYSHRRTRMASDSLVGADK